MIFNLRFFRKCRVILRERFDNLISEYELGKSRTRNEQDLCLLMGLFNNYISIGLHLSLYPFLNRSLLNTLV